ncbi:MAG: hypothetical protein ACT4PE_09220 [Candidatus Eiseniibacteriota bacterium]
MRSRSVLLFALLATSLLAPACGDDDDSGTNPNPNPNTLVFVGTVNGDNGSLSASISLTVTGTTVTGTLEVVAPAAATHALTGTYDTTSRALAAAGGGYNFAGVFDGGDRLEGLMSGAASGTFVTAKDDNNAALAFCGTFTGTDDGVFNFTIDGSTLSGSATTTSGTLIALDGTVSSNSIVIVMPSGSGTLATGTRSGANVSGTWDDGVGGSGTWTGAQCN